MEIYTGIGQFDFQILRFTGELKKRYQEVSNDLKTIGHSIIDFETWYLWWYAKAEEYEKKQLLEIAMTYYRASLFYLSFSDERKLDAYQHFRRCFEACYQDKNITYHSIPYQSGNLPAIYIPCFGATETLLVIGGFDSFMEELVNWFYPLQSQLNMNLLLFDGPGQGSVPFQRLYFDADYEKIVTTVLNEMHLEEVDAIGISWGGYFVLRAAAFEKRIKRCICFDIFYSGRDALQMQTGSSAYLLLRIGLFLKQKRLINSVITDQAQSNVDLQWMLQQGFDITGENNPYDFIKNITHHDLKGVLPLVTQECLLLAGSEDRYVPKERLSVIQKELTHAKKVTAKLFDSETGGELHCQIDHIEPALKEIVTFLTTH